MNVFFYLLFFQQDKPKEAKKSKKEENGGAQPEEEEEEVSTHFSTTSFEEQLKLIYFYLEICRTLMAMKKLKEKMRNMTSHTPKMMKLKAKVRSAILAKANPTSHSIGSFEKSLILKLMLFYRPTHRNWECFSTNHAILSINLIKSYDSCKRHFQSLFAFHIRSLSS